MALLSIVVGIDPVAFTIGPVSIRWYGVLVVVAVLFICLWVWRMGRRVGITGGFILSAAPWAIVSAIIVSRLIHVVDRLDIYASNPQAILGFEGMTIFGAILGAVAGVWVYCRVRRIPFGPLGDVAAPGVILAQAIGRAGCTINGCCHGQTTSLPWAFVYTHPDSMAPVGVAVHPTQLYELVWDVVVFALLFWVFRGRLRPPGSLFGVYVALYSLGVLGIRFLRGDTHAIIGPFHEGQIIALSLLIISVALLVWKTRWVRGGGEAAGAGEGPDDASGDVSGEVTMSIGSTAAAGRDNGGDAGLSGEKGGA